MPQYLLSVWHDDDYELDFSTPDAQRQGAQVGAFNEQLQQSGTWVFACGLHPASSATVVRSVGGDVSMTDGPYAETKEQMGGLLGHSGRGHGRTQPGSTTWRPAIFAPGSTTSEPANHRTLELTLVVHPFAYGTLTSR
jgi:hypothetical protein